MCRLKVRGPVLGQSLVGVAACKGRNAAPWDGVGSCGRPPSFVSLNLRNFRASVYSRDSDLFLSKLGTPYNGTESALAGALPVFTPRNFPKKKCLVLT